MALLKKIKASTLMETLVASVLIVIIFMVASLILNNLFANNIKFNTQHIESELNELEYSIQNKLIKVPYTTTYENWELSAIETVHQNTPIVHIEAKNKEINKTIKRIIFFDKDQ